MTLVIPNLGVVQAAGEDLAALGSSGVLAPFGTGQGSTPRNRPDPRTHANVSEGLHVMMSRVPGLTDPGYLTSPFLFQVPPIEDFTYTGGRNWQDYDTVSDDQHSRKQSRVLRQTSFRSMFVDEQGTYTILRKPGWVPDSSLLVNEVVAISENGIIFRLTAWQPVIYDRATLDMLATLRSYEITVPVGEEEIHYFSLSFVEHRPLSGTSQFVREDGLPAVVDIDTLKPPEDTLYALAQKHYGDPSKWKMIARHNGLQVAPSQSLVDAISPFRGNTARKVHIPARPQQRVNARSQG